MKPIIYPIAILTGIYASINTMSLMFAIQNTTPSELISKAKNEIIIHDKTKSQHQALCQTELKVPKQQQSDKDVINIILKTLV